MILLAAIVLALLATWLAGGRLMHLGQVSLRHAWLMPLALAIQVVIFSAGWQARMWPALTDACYIASNLLLLLAVWINRRVQGIPLIGLGLLCNAAAIFANGGHMPTSMQALTTAGIASPNQTFEALDITNSGLISADTPLWFLGDVFALPAWLPLANIFSLGDVLIGLGAVQFVWVHMRTPTPETATPRLTSDTPRG